MSDIEQRIAQALLDAGPPLVAESVEHWADSVAAAIVAELQLRVVARHESGAQIITGRYTNSADRR